MNLIVLWLSTVTMGVLVGLAVTAASPLGAMEYGCYSCDYNLDQEVDLMDFATMQRCFGESIVTDEGICRAGDGMGDTVRLCKIYHEPDARLVLEFERPVRNVWYSIDGPDPMIEVWLQRDAVGDASRALVYEPNSTDRPWGLGIGADPGYVAVRIRGRLLKLEDVVYDQGP